MNCALIGFWTIVAIIVIAYFFVLHFHAPDENKAVHYQRIFARIFRFIIVASLITLVYFSNELLPLTGTPNEHSNFPSVSRTILWTELLRVLIKGLFLAVITWGIVRILATED